MREDAMYGFTPAELLWYYEDSVDSELFHLWFRFDKTSLRTNPAFIPRLPRFEDRRDTFLRLVAAFLELEYVKLERRNFPDAPQLPESVADQVVVLRKVLPDSDEGMEDGDTGLSWFLLECPFDVTWGWPRRSPRPLFPSHNPEFMYIDDWHGWDGVIPPEWERWKFTPGRLQIDDFDSYEDYRAFNKAYPNYYRVTPRIERIAEERMNEDAMRGFTPAELLWYLEGAEELNMNALWGPFHIESLNSNAPFIPRLPRFEDRRDAFLRLVAAFLELGYLQLVQQWVPDAPEVPGSVAEQVEALREVFPSSDEEMEMGELEVSWFLVQCPFDVNWYWPRRAPTPLFPGHNPRFDYLEDWGNWVGVIPPEWSQWKFTPNRLIVDDFDSYDDYRAFNRAYPAYYTVTPYVERVTRWGWLRSLRQLRALLTPGSGALRRAAPPRRARRVRRRPYR